MGLASRYWDSGCIAWINIDLLLLLPPMFLLVFCLFFCFTIFYYFYGAVRGGLLSVHPI